MICQKCKREKAIHFFSPSDAKRERPVCRECRKAYRRSVAVKPSGGDFRHFCIKAERVKI